MWVWNLVAWYSPTFVPRLLEVSKLAAPISTKQQKFSEIVIPGRTSESSHLKMLFLLLPDYRLVGTAKKCAWLPAVWRRRWFCFEPSGTTQHTDFTRDLCSAFDWLITDQILPAITSFSASKLCWQPALSENPDYVHQMSRKSCCW